MITLPPYNFKAAIFSLVPLHNVISIEEAIAVTPPASLCQRKVDQKRIEPKLYQLKSLWKKYEEKKNMATRYDCNIDTFIACTRIV